MLWFTYIQTCIHTCKQVEARRCHIPRHLITQVSAKPFEQHFQTAERQLSNKFLAGISHAPGTTSFSTNSFSPVAQYSKSRLTALAMMMWCICTQHRRVSSEGMLCSFALTSLGSEAALCWFVRRKWREQQHTISSKVLTRPKPQIRSMPQCSSSSFPPSTKSNTKCEELAQVRPL